MLDFPLLQIFVFIVQRHHSHFGENVRFVSQLFCIYNIAHLMTMMMILTFENNAPYLSPSLYLSLSPQKKDSNYTTNFISSFEMRLPSEYGLLLLFLLTTLFRFDFRIPLYDFSHSIYFTKTTVQRCSTRVRCPILVATVAKYLFSRER